MSANNSSNFAEVESYEAERSMLLEIQKSHTDTLGAIGALAIAELCVSDFEDRFSNYSTRSVVTITTPKFNLEKILGQGAMVPAIEFQATRIGFDGKSKVSTTKVRVADYDIEGHLMAVNGFNDRQKSTVTGMVEGLQAFKEIGILSYLNGHLTALDSRQDSMDRHPSNK